jgi:hypothetical protein
MAILHGNVIEVKNMATGKTHTPAEFAKDKKKGKLKRAMVGR